MQDVASLFREFLHLDRKRGGAGLSPGELLRWTYLKGELNREFDPGRRTGGPDRRQSVRIPVRLAIGFRDRGQLSGSLMTDLSRGGVFVETDRPAEIGTRVELRLSIEASGEELAIPAEVVSQNTGPDLSSPRPGMGLRFLKMSDAARREIDALYERKLAEAAEAIEKERR